MHNVGFEPTTHSKNWKHMPQKNFWLGGDRSQIFQEEKHCYELIETNVVKTTRKILVWSLISPQELAHGIWKFAYPLSTYPPFLDFSKLFPNVEN
jgi:hypothetical protein